MEDIRVKRRNEAGTVFRALRIALDCSLFWGGNPKEDECIVAMIRKINDEMGYYEEIEPLSVIRSKFSRFEIIKDSLYMLFYRIRNRR